MSGFRAAREQYHYRTIQSLFHTIHAEPELIAQLDVFRKKRNATQYDRIQAISAHEAGQMVDLAVQMRDRVVKWLAETRPDLVE